MRPPLKWIGAAVGVSSSAALRFVVVTKAYRTKLPGRRRIDASAGIRQSSSHVREGCGTDNRRCAVTVDLPPDLKWASESSADANHALLGANRKLGVAQGCVLALRIRLIPSRWWTE